MVLTNVSDRYFTLIEQALISGSNFLLYLYATRSLPKENWGELSMALAALLVIQGFQRAFVTLPMSTSGDSPMSFMREALPFWCRAQVAIILLTIPLIILAYGIAVPYGAAWVVRCIEITAILMVPMYYLEFARRVVILGVSMQRLVGMAVIYSCVLAIGALGIWFWNLEASTTAFVFTIISGALCSCCYARISLAPRALIQHSATWNARKLWHFGKWGAGSSIAYSGYNFAVQAILAIMIGPTAVAVFAATRNLAQPINVVVQAMDSVDKPRAARAYHHQGLQGLWLVTKRSWTWLLAIAIPYFVLVGYFAEDVLALAYGDKYSKASPELLLWFLVLLFMILVQPVESALYVLRKPKWMFFGRLAAALLVLCVAPFVAAAWSVKGALAALALGWSIAGIAAGMQFYMLSKQGDTL